VSESHTDAPEGKRISQLSNPHHSITSLLNGNSFHLAQTISYTSMQVAHVTCAFTKFAHVRAFTK